MQGTIIRGIGGFFYALDAEGSVHTLRAQGKIRREKLKPLVGDRVEMEPGTGEEDGWILKVLPRKNELIRPPVANVDILLIAVPSAVPEPDPEQADLLLLLARRAGIRPMLLITKSDLAPEAARRLADQYRGADAEPLCVSAVTGEGVALLRDRLRGMICAFAGASGAGKSSLINAMYGLTLETGDLSRKIERGKNTTRRCELIPVEGGGGILDTPGFSLLETEPMDPDEMRLYWPEFTEYEGRCFFSPCRHTHEPRCAVRAAVEEGRIDASRHERYTALTDEMIKRWRERYG